MNTFVEKPFQKILFPLNLFHTIFFMQKFHIKDNFINPKNFGSKVLSFCGLVFYVSFYTFRIFLMTTVKENTVSRYRHSIFDCFSYSVGFLFNFICCVMESNFNVTLILNVQGIFKATGDNNGVLNKITVKVWIHILSLFSYYSLVALHFFISKGVASIVEVATLYMLFAFDINIIYAVTIINILLYVLKWWVVEVNSCVSKLPISDEIHWNKYLFMYGAIVRSYNMYIKVLQIMVSKQRCWFTNTRHSSFQLLTVQMCYNPLAFCSVDTHLVRCNHTFLSFCVVDIFS